ncbi:MAG: PP2C family serine/threonine-protein phosphatase [Aulosira sp. ZfuVER01]|nr:protein phosphatase 2C domain-containing protein [Aulosira sp. ZfuVER01]MDZ7999060.1 protein phosphatase 2C domain-containing protein [Aulosira sp. DedVER01a]MDZ8051216.1 protein phosphatase 2C domain-containing protein [Aulosira sp. ZfuCHP01]
MQCLSCGASILAGDRFCEECGTPLTASKPPTATQGCEKCGAGIEAIDIEGYCTNCGFRRELKERDYLEVIINSQLAGASDRGFRHHRNEDFFALQQINNSQVNILVVCDGVSSAEQPDLAARTAAETASLELATVWQTKEKPELAIQSAFVAALNSVCKIPYVSSVNSDPPSTTIVAAIVHNHTATIGWLGDSRAYWISANATQQLTQDDSWLYEVVAAGEMTEAEARQSPKAHAITRWLGADAVADAIPSIVNFTIPGSGYLLLCTDGLWNYTPEPWQLAKLIQQSSSKDAISVSRNLVEFARQSGGHDNITVAILAL